MPRSSVDIIRKTKLHLGAVVAKTEKEAIEAAVKLFKIAPSRQFKITVPGLPSYKSPDRALSKVGASRKRVRRVDAHCQARRPRSMTALIHG